jgi:hypothetical protein
MSQSVFAATLNVSPKLVQSWEQGTRRPGRGDLRLLQILDQRPGIVSEVVALADPARRPPAHSVVAPKPSRPRKRRAVA